MRQLPQMPPQLNVEALSLPDKLHSVDLGRYEQVRRRLPAVAPKPVVEHAHLLS